MKKLLFILLTLITSCVFAQGIKVIKVKGTPGAYNFSKSGDSIIFYVAGVRQALSVGTVTDLSNYYNKTDANDLLGKKRDTSYYQVLTAQKPLKFTQFTPDSSKISMNLDSTINNSDSSVPTSNAVNKYVNRTTDGYALSSISPNVNTNGTEEMQGVATDSLGNIYVIGTTMLKKYDSSYNLIATNTTPFTGTSGFVHMNDGDIYKGKLVIPTYNLSPVYKTALLVYNLDLTLYKEYPMPDAVATGISAGAVSNDTLYLSSFTTPPANIIWKFKMPDYITTDTVRLISSMTFTPLNSINRVQGIDVDSVISLATDYGEIYTCNLDGSNFKFKYKIDRGDTLTTVEGLDINKVARMVLEGTSTGVHGARIEALVPTNTNQFYINNGILTAYIQSLFNGNVTVNGDLTILQKQSINFRLSNTSKSLFSIWHPDNLSYLAFLDSASSISQGLFLAQGGKVGINKNAPTEALDVVGNIKGTGLVTGGTASKTSANLAAELSDETGTGLSVFNISPTFNSTVTFKNSTATLANVSLGSTGGVVQTFGTSAGQMSGVFSFDGSDAANSAYVAMGIATSGSYFGTTGASIFASSKNGTGTQLPFVFGGFNGSWSDWMVLTTSGKMSLGAGRTPTAILHLKAGTATASTAPLKFTSGTNLTTAENGAVEYDGTNYYITSNSTRYILTKTLIGTAAPTTTPLSVGVHFIDTTNKKEYVSTGTISSSDWTILN